MRLARHAIDADRFGFQSQAEIVDESGNARVLHTGIRFELISRDDGTRTDEFDLAGNIELATLLSELRRHPEQFIISLFAAHLWLI